MLEADSLGLLAATDDLYLWISRHNIFSNCNQQKRERENEEENVVKSFLYYSKKSPAEFTAASTLGSLFGFAETYFHTS